MEILEQKLLELIEKDSNIDLKELKRVLKFDEEEEKYLENTLFKLEINGEIYKNKNGTYVLLKNKPSICCGKAHFLTSGDLLVTNKLGSQVIIPKDKVNGILEKDIICAKRISVDNKNKVYGIVDKIIKRNSDQISCEVIFKNGRNSLIPYNSKCKSEIRVDQKELDKHGVGEILLIRLITKSNQLDGHFIKTIGHKDEPDVDEKTIAYDHGFEVEFNKKIIKELEKIPNSVDVNKALKEGRKDLRDKNIFTIDGSDTKDIDDSICIEKISNGNYKLYVNIADVSYYVKEQTLINDEAYNRATSVYMNDTVIPMLPPKISNGICSLHPNVDRLTKTCEMIIDSKGNIIDYEIYDSIIRSKKKMTYDKVNDILLNNKKIEGYEDFYKDLFIMNELSELMNERKQERGYINFDKSEIKAKGKGSSIIFDKRTQNVGEKLIENFMLAANETVANHVYYRSLPFIYRIHEAPDEEKIKNFLTILKNNDIPFKNCKNITSNKYIQGIVKELNGIENNNVLSELLLINTMKKAKYSNINLKHFGLALKCYTHFTSPIRRYADLQVHRLLNIYDKTFDFDYSEMDNFLNTVANQCSKKSNDAKEAEREAREMRISEYMENNIGKTFDGYISSISSSSVSVRTVEGFSGIISLDDLGDKHLCFNPNLNRLYSTTSGKIYTIGSPIKIKVKEASKKARIVRFIGEDKILKETKSSIKTKKRNHTK